MKTIKRPYTPVCDLELVPVECISDFAVILPRAFIAVRDGSYRIPVHSRSRIRAGGFRNYIL